MHRKTGHPRKYRGGEPRQALLPKTIRQLLFAMAIPSAMSGCAHHPPASEAPVTSAKRVFRVVPSAAVKHDTYASSLPELSDSFSSAAIIQHILLRHQKTPGDSDGKSKSGHGAKRAGRWSKARQVAATAASQVAATAASQVAATTRVKLSSPLPSRKSRGRGDHWDTVRGRMVLAGVTHELVDAHLEQLRQHPGAVDFLMKRAEPYLPHLLEEINRHGLPTDLVLVPMVESAFEPTALSPKQAAGIWQFIPSTGQQYGLEVSDRYDGRYDLHAATQAACKYLKHLNQLFQGDWLLALAAYNAGEGAVRRAVEASRKAGAEGGFWDLELPAETEAYVVKILSLARAVADPASLGLKVRRFSGPSTLVRVQVGPEVRMADLIALAGMVPEAFYKLNPAFKPDAEPPAAPHNLLLPREQAQTLATRLDGAKVHAALTVVVKKGETLALLAKRHGVPALKLAEWNHLTPGAQLKAGQELVVYPV